MKRLTGVSEGLWKGCICSHVRNFRAVKEAFRDVLKCFNESREFLKVSAVLGSFREVSRVKGGFIGSQVNSREVSGELCEAFQEVSDKFYGLNEFQGRFSKRRRITNISRCFSGSFEGAWEGVQNIKWRAREGFKRVFGGLHDGFRGVLERCKAFREVPYEF